VITASRSASTPSVEDAARLGDFKALSEQAARDIPRAERVVIPDCGHIPHLEFPDQFLREFLPFLAR
jgi:pimeloyl-ACP methyl ester carboxylesterase